MSVDPMGRVRWLVQQAEAAEAVAEESTRTAAEKRREALGMIPVGTVLEHRLEETAVRRVSHPARTIDRISEFVTHPGGEHAAYGWVADQWLAGNWDLPAVTP